MHLSRSRLTPLLVVAVLACGGKTAATTTPNPPLDPDQVLSTDATIRYINLEGGCWLLEIPSGARYEPINLASTYRVDGMAVNVTLKDAPDMASICMAAPLVDIVSIKTR